MQVSAGNGPQYFSGSFDFNYDGSNGATTGSTTIVRMSNGCLHFEVPIVVRFSDSDSVYNPETWYELYLQFTDFSSSINQYAHSSISNVYLKYQNELTMPLNDKYNYHVYKQGKDLNWANNYWNFPCYICFDLSGYSNTVDTNWRCNWSASIYYFFGVSSYQGDTSTKSVSDAQTHQLQNDTNNKLDTQIQQENNAQTTRTGILNKITEFFGSFFSNLIGVFVPEDGFFTTWFNNLNTLLEAKLGILYYPFSKVIYLLNQLTSAFSGSANPNIIFPAIEFTNSATGETYTFLSAQTVNLNDFNIVTSSSANSTLVGSSGYGSLIDIIRTLNGFVLVMAMLGLLRQKLNLILRGEDNDS